MIHKIKYGYMKVVLETSLDDDCRAPDLFFKGEGGREFAVFFAPASTTEGAEMEANYYDFYSDLNFHEDEYGYCARLPLHERDEEDTNDEVPQRP